MEQQYVAKDYNVFVVTTNYVPGYKIVKVIGLSWGLVVRSRGIGGNIAAGLKSIVGGEIGAYTKMLNDARLQAIQRLVEHAKSLGANAVISTRFDSSEIGNVMTEILAYGTAVVVEPLSTQPQPVNLS